MERLTKRDPFDGIIELTKEIGEPISPYNEVMEALCKLAAYEDTGMEPEEITDFLPTLKEWRQNMGALRHVHELVTAEAEGRMLVLPCKVGDELWFEKNGLLRCETVDRVQVEQTDIDDGWYVSICTMSVSVLAEDIGRLVWLTREEAEAKLKQEVESDG